MRFCSARGCAATVDPRRLVAPCQKPSAKGRENLSRIFRGLFPPYRGPPAAISSAQVVALASEVSPQRAGVHGPVELDEYL
eukprot:1705125-Pyramimonas_sp.AAC.1